MRLIHTNSKYHSHLLHNMLDKQNGEKLCRRVFDNEILGAVTLSLEKEKPGSQKELPGLCFLLV